MKLITWIREMLDSENTASSKRFCAVLGWLICMFVLVWCTIYAIQPPSMVETVLYIIAGLLGIDKISDIFRSKKGIKS